MFGLSSIPSVHSSVKKSHVGKDIIQHDVFLGISFRRSTYLVSINLSASKPARPAIISLASS